MKKWTEIKEEINSIDTYDCAPGEVAQALQELTAWLNEYFYGERRNRDSSVSTKIGENDG